MHAQARECARIAKSSQGVALLSAGISASVIRSSCLPGVSPEEVDPVRREKPDSEPRRDPPQDFEPPEKVASDSHFWAPTLRHGIGAKASSSGPNWEGRIRLHLCIFMLDLLESGSISLPGFVPHFRAPELRFISRIERDSNLSTLARISRIVLQFLYTKSLPRWLRTYRRSRRAPRPRDRMARADRSTSSSRSSDKTPTRSTFGKQPPLPLSLNLAQPPC